MKPGAVNMSAEGRSPALASTSRVDEAFFRGYVEPILQKRGKDGYLRA